MHTIPKSGVTVQSAHATPLFSWAERHDRGTLSIATRRLIDRFGFTPTRARLVAELAGLPTDHVEACHGA